MRAGSFSIISATMPVTAGVAIDVPQLRPMPCFGIVETMPWPPSLKSRQPGATTSGLTRPLAVGPQPENAVIALESASMAPTVITFFAVPGASTVR